MTIDAEALAGLRSPALRTLAERGFVRDCTDLAGLDAALSAGPVPAYAGFDLNADSLHVGSMIPLMALRHLRRAGPAGAPDADAAHVLLGDATTRVGDPSGRTGARTPTGPDAIERNRPGVVDCVRAVVGSPVPLHLNSAWLDRLSFMDFLTGPARVTSLNRMVATDVVATRLEADLPMTLMELVYQTMQAMDFAHLARTRGVRLQIGGSDQWANVLAGVELARRMDGAKLFGLTLPLLVDSTGAKMGKSAAGTAVWLHPARTTSFDLWQFLRNVPDDRVGSMLGLLTEVPMDEARDLVAGGGASLNRAKEILATEAVAIAHGWDAAESARDAARATASRGPVDAGAASGLPCVACPHDPDATVVTIADLLLLAGLAASRGEARRTAAGGGVRLGGVRATGVDAPLERSDFADGPVVLSVGRGRHVRVEPYAGSRSTRPVSARLDERPDGWSVVGAFPWRDGSTEEDVLASGLSREEAGIHLGRVRLAESAS